QGFTEADKVIQAMGLSWPAVIASLIGLRLLGPILRGVAGGLAAIAVIPGILPLLAGLATAYGAAVALKAYRDKQFGAAANADPTPGRKPFTLEDIQTTLQGGTVWDRFRQRGEGDVWKGIIN